MHSPRFSFASYPPAFAATWHSHFTLLRKIADGDDDVVLIFEDDVDMEWDLEKRLRYLCKFLPDQQWDQFMLGSLAIVCKTVSNSYSWPLVQGIASLTKMLILLCRVLHISTHLQAPSVGMPTW